MAEQIGRLVLVSVLPQMVFWLNTRVQPDKAPRPEILAPYF